MSQLSLDFVCDKPSIDEQGVKRNKIKGKVQSKPKLSKSSTAP